MDPTTLAALSRRQFLQLTGLGLASAALLGGCFLMPQPPAPTPPRPAVPLAKKIGQMLILGFRGLTVDEQHPIVQDIREHHLGGVVLFDYDVPNDSPIRNIQSPEQVKALTQALQSHSQRRLFIAIDQEGGRINRLKEKFGFPPSVSHQFLGTTDDLAVTREHASTTARTLRQVGINLNFAPVVDLNTNPRNPIIGQIERSFSDDPEVVTRHALEFIRAHHEQGIRCTIKHFPGHGSSTRDSHKGMVDVTDTWSRSELEPYRRIIQADQADAIMTAHVYNSDLDTDYPATLSRPTIHGILRTELGYNGVVISDDMQMRAVSKHFGFETAVEAAIKAGVDVLIFADQTTGAQQEGLAARITSLINQLIQEGRLSEARIDRSFERILALKRNLGS